MNEAQPNPDTRSEVTYINISLSLKLRTPDNHQTLIIIITYSEG